MGKKGTVRDVRLGKTSGHKMLDESALKAAFKSKFTPATVDGKPVAVWVTYAIDLAPEDKKDPEQ